MTEDSPQLPAPKKAAAKAPAKRKPGPKPRTDWQSPFLEGYSLHGIITRAARNAGVDRSTVEEERKRNPTFALALEEAREAAADNLESFAYTWATTGLKEKVEEKTYDHEGNVTATKVRETANVSPALLIFLLKAFRPAKYRETFRVENTGADGGPIRVKVEGAAASFFAELDRLGAQEVIEDAEVVAELPPDPSPESTTPVAR